MLLKDFLKEGNIFNEINLVEMYPFIDGNEDLLNSMLITQYGERQVYEAVRVISLSTLARMIILDLGSGWDIETAIGDLGRKFEDTHTVTETINNNEVRLSTGDRTNKVSAFNSDELIDNDGTTNTDSDDLTGVKTKTLTDVKTSAKERYKTLSSLSKRSIITFAVSDVAKYLTLSIY